MKKINLLLILLLPLLSFAQNYQEVTTTEVIDGESMIVVRTTEVQNRNFDQYNLFKSATRSASQDYADAVTDGVVFDFDAEAVAGLRRDNPSQLNLEIPFNKDGSTIKLELTKVNIHSPSFIVKTNTGRDITNEIDLGVHYEGTVSGQSNSLVGISVFNNEVMGFIDAGKSQFTLGKLTDSELGHILYENADLKTSYHLNCDMEDDESPYRPEDLVYTQSRAPGDCVEIYVEAGQSVINAFGGDLTLATNFLNGVFAQSFIVYANEGITMQMSELFVWETPDPYTFGTTGGQLGEFQAQTAAINGDLGHLVEVQNIGGLAAGFSGICNANVDNSLCFSGFSGTSFNNVPASSFNVYIITHEMGHLMGSRHTHACVWNGTNTAIDGCSGFTEGACAVPPSPPGGGTIMSYCINDPVGVDFAEGFHPQPQAVMLNTVDNATCLGTCAACALDVDCSLITDQTLSCRADLPSVDFNLPIIVESCGDVTLSALTIIPGDTGCPGDEISITRTYFIQDADGNMAQCMQTFTIVSNVLPTIVCPAGGVVECAADISVSPNDAFVTSECGTPVTSVSGPVIVGTPDCPLTTYTYTYTVTDHCGRTASCPQVFTILNTEPTIVCPADRFVECAADINVDPNDAVVTTSCTLGFNTVVSGPDIDGPPDCPGTTYTYTYTTTDDCGRMAQCKQTFTIQNAGPSIVCPADIVVACEDEINLNPNDAVVNTFCGLGYTVYIKQPLQVGATGCNGTVYTYIYKVVDDCGNTAKCEQQVLIQNTPASISVPGGGIVNCFADIDISVGDATVNNACAEYELYLDAPTINGPIGCPGTTYTYTYRLLDVCGNNIEENVVFTNANTAPPTIQAPDDLVTTCLGGTNPNPDDATVTAACESGYDVTVTGPVIIGTMDCPGTRYRYTYTVTDECGRSASDTQDFFVQNGPPEFAGCEEDNWLQFNCEDYGGEAGTIAVIEAYIASVKAYSSCGVSLNVSNNFNSNNISTCYNGVPQSIIFFATDNCGRTTTCTTYYVVTDTEAPDFIEEAEDHWEMCNYNSSDNFEDWVDDHGGAVAYDGCSTTNVSWSTIPANPSFNCIGNSGTTSVTVTFVATDNCGNSASTTATFNTLPNPGGMMEQEGDVETTGQAVSGDITLYQNRPNPFKAETLISFNLPEATLATLTIYDINGRVLKVVEGDYYQGLNEVLINRSELSTTGIVYYTLRTQTETATKIMVLMD